MASIIAKPAISVALRIISISFGLFINRIASKIGERSRISNCGNRSIINFLNLASLVDCESHGSEAALACPCKISSRLSFPISAGLRGVYKYGAPLFISPVPTKSFAKDPYPRTRSTPVSFLIKSASSADSILP